MKRTIIGTLFFTTFLSPAMAADVPFTSEVGEVTVFPRGAEVTRFATGSVPAGDNVVIVSDLPGNLVANSVRVEGTAETQMQIGSVDVRRTIVSENDNLDERKKIERQIEALSDQIAELDQTIINANTRRKMLQEMASSAILPRPTGQGGSIAVSANELKEILTLTATRQDALSKVTEKARIEKRQLSRQIDDLRNQIAQSAPKRRQVTTVSINLNAPAASDARFRIRYNVSNAGWAPVYDARLTLGRQGKQSRVKLIRRANVRQATTDKWQNIKLTLSTARPSAATQAPALSPYIISKMEIRPYARKRVLRQKSTFGARDNMVAPAPQMEVAPPPTVAMANAGAAIALSGFLAEYKIPGKVTISNAGAQKNVIIGEREFKADIAANTTPRLDQTAYLTAKFTLKGGAPYLPGTVLLSRDGVYLGRGHLPLLNPDEEHKLSFGRDDFVKVKRTRVAQKAGESGFVSRTKEDTRKFVTTVKNLHDFPIKVVVNDFIPYATHEDITVKMTPDSTKPTKTNVDKKRGILAWEKTVDAKAEYIIKFGYTVSWPGKMQITPVQ
ncbi:MAG TPA: mucoidy inhibitor MuiA family protein [Rhizobiales bacterium]|nr:mucoidy inhibitor MuiA family protein [Hyphomicrobiales bacterium]